MMLSAAVSVFLARELKSYDPHHRLGKGSFGTVFSGVKKLPGPAGQQQAAAIKVQRAEDEGAVQREHRCIQRLMDRPHPNVIKIWAYIHDVQGGTAAIIMEAGLGSLLHVQRQYSPGLSTPRAPSYKC